ncbi:MAG TPA: class I SAM-dependent methyltransferase [Candidatus Sulfotelmatobacter sp.]|nr:class I SAM-dependent methyltransferase [Candidatus Sulfotelmatobacter sp.]
MNPRDRNSTGNSDVSCVPINQRMFLFHSQTSPPYAVEYGDGSFDLFGSGAPLFKILAKTPADFERLFKRDPYSLAVGFVRGQFSVEGDLATAVRVYYAQAQSRLRTRLLRVLAKLAIERLEGWFQTKHRAAENIRFHYDHSNDFYRLFLDSRLVYSCAYFNDPEQPLDDAQVRKLAHICRKLNLQPGEQFLDVGCGWGALVTYAAEAHGAFSTGCTLSSEQFNFANRQVADRALGPKARIQLSHYRDIEGTFDKIASVGMFEHVGRRRLQGYFQKLYCLTRPGGLVLNHGITRPENVRDSPETLFVRRHVFPGGELPRLSEVIRFAETAGFEVLDVENLRPHYALTCRAWVGRLQENVTRCLREVEHSIYRTWLLALAASAAYFEEGLLNVNQVLLYKAGHPARRPFTREYIYARPSE